MQQKQTFHLAVVFDAVDYGVPTYAVVKCRIVGVYGRVN
jgi:hypothetical protein